MMDGTVAHKFFLFLDELADYPVRLLWVYTPVLLCICAVTVRSTWYVMADIYDIIRPQFDFMMEMEIGNRDWNVMNENLLSR